MNMDKTGTKHSSNIAHLLAIDTSGTSTCVAARTKCDHRCTHHDAHRDHARHLLPLVDTVLKELNITAQDIDLFVVTKGPGSFVGLRIGLSAIKGFVAATDKPFVSINTLAPMCAPYRTHPIVVVPIIRATRLTYYTAAFKHARQVCDTINCDYNELARFLRHVYEREQNEIIIAYRDDTIIEEIGAIINESVHYKIEKIFIEDYTVSLSILGEQQYMTHGGDPSDSAPDYIRKISAEMQ